MTKVIIQIPCYNEEGTLGVTLDALPRELPGVDVIEVLIIDDGSRDRTAEVAREHGVHHIVRQPYNMGLARAFMRGLEACLDNGADIIVNTDADNQYNADDIPKLIEPILSGNAGMVIGSRPIEQIAHFSWLKKRLQKLGSWAVRMVSGQDVPDAPSGFRAFSREAAMKLNVFNPYTYTLETIIQAAHKEIILETVAIRVNGDLRPSRLVKSYTSYIYRSVSTMFRYFVIYRPFRFFCLLATVPFTGGFLIGARFVYYYATGQGGGKIQSLILAALLMGMGFTLFTVALLSDLISVNRKLSERLHYQVKKLEQDRK